MKQVVIKQLQDLLQEGNGNAIKQSLPKIKKEYRTIVDERKQQVYQKFIDDGGEAGEFKFAKDPMDEDFYLLVDQANDKVKEYQEEEKRKQKDYANERLSIIDELKNMVSSESNIGKGFDMLQTLQEKWKNAGKVFGEKGKELEYAFKHQMDRFYHNVNINREMRDMHFSRSIEAKTEALNGLKGLIELDDVKQIATEARKYRNAWREAGPVSPDKREAMFEEYKNINDQLNAKLDNYYESRREELTEKLKIKITLCEEVNALNEQSPQSPKEWNAITESIQALQEKWKGIGFSDENETIWGVFRNSIDTFFENKRKFFAQLDGLRKEFAEKKEALIAQAEKVQDSTEWKNTTNYLINLQKEWKEIGAAPRGQENQLWERFRAACDRFFNQKSEYFANIDDIHNENLAKKEALIEQINNTDLSGDAAKDFPKIKEFFGMWNAIGHVPMDKKDELYDKYKAALDSKFSQLNASKEEQNKMRRQSELEEIMNADNAQYLLDRKKEGIRNRIEKLEDEIAQTENNLGFFKGNTNMVADYEKKIERLKRQVVDLKKDLKQLPNEIVKPSENLEEAVSESIETDGQADAEAPVNV